ncbi:VF530 family DNA-binding protein [Shewanella psychrotolerans]|uniref:VF530 family protein n=1 Tax=Shewanella psychrotolerans TaxID=2864206 RepID=UPI001C658F23|nr:VF530 family protein [Shewanella psychrotolerans]QYK02679.1 VF530 family protein [Shewanella psychrotolerans]
MTQANNPLHGIKLENLLNDLVDHYGWEELGQRIDIRCFNHDPSIKSSLKFLRKTPWAREKVEYLYLKMNKLPLPKLKPQQDRPVSTSSSTSEDKHSSSVNANIWGKNE